MFQAAFIISNLYFLRANLLRILGYSEGRKTTELSYKFFIFPPLQATTFNFLAEFLGFLYGSLV